MKVLKKIINTDYETILLLIDIPNTVIRNTKPRHNAMKDMENPCRRRRPAQLNLISTKAQIRLIA